MADPVLEYVKKNGHKKESCLQLLEGLHAYNLLEPGELEQKLDYADIRYILDELPVDDMDDLPPYTAVGEETRYRNEKTGQHIIFRKNPVGWSHWGYHKEGLFERARSGVTQKVKDIYDELTTPHITSITYHASYSDWTDLEPSILNFRTPDNPRKYELNTTTVTRTSSETVRITFSGRHIDDEDMDRLQPWVEDLEMRVLTMRRPFSRAVMEYRQSDPDLYLSDQSSLK